MSTEDTIRGNKGGLYAAAVRDAKHTPGPWIAHDNITASQGVCLGRAGQVDLQRDENGEDEGQVWVGGQSVTCIDGVVTL